MKKNILIIGGTGFLGYHLIKRCLKNNFNVYSFSTHKPIRSKKINRVKYYTGDINKVSSYKFKKIKFDTVVNLAGYIDHSKKRKVFDSHYIGVKKIANFFSQNKTNKFIQIGSSVEYGFVKSPVKENSKINKRSLKSIYGLSKFLATDYMQKIYAKNNQKYLIIRPFLIYGPYQNINRLIPFVINQCKLGKSFPCSSGEQVRDFLYIDDFINLLIESIKKQKIKNGIYNAGSGKPITVKTVIKLIKSEVKKGYPLYGKLKMRKDEPSILYANIKKTKKEFKWQPKISIKKGIKETVKFFLKNEIR